YLSLTRIFLAIPLWFSMQYHKSMDPFYLAIVIAIIAAATDYYDGYFARKYNQVTEWGKILDPIGDKVCIAVIVIQLYLHDRMGNFMLAILVGRDALILLAGILLSKKIGKVLPSTDLGKYTVTIIAIYLFFIAMRLDYDFEGLNVILVFVVVLISILSLSFYAQRAIETLRKGKK
ncbi:MAG: CDP-alcohol phosphatidyltransferase family protein, partial [Ignavibacteria bacterium]|nr:CDP-alcohol phosphatidyltransferase family protein [Ignavibacteria bacterium]